MADKWQTIHSFWSGFTWDAYDQSSVPDDATYPRITYEAATGSFDDYPRQGVVSLWDRSTSWAAISQKADEIGAVIGQGGSYVAYTGGALWITRGTPWAQRMTDEDDMIRRIVLSPVYQFMSEN